MPPNVESGAGYLVKRVQQSLRRNCDAALRSIGLSMAQYTALRALADHPQASAAEMARLCFVTRQSLQDVLSGLRTEGLVEESPGPQRGRARALQLTAAGRRRLGQAHSAVIHVEQDMLNGLSGKEQKELATMLLRCAENLEAAAPVTTVGL